MTRRLWLAVVVMVIVVIVGWLYLSGWHATAEKYPSVGTKLSHTDQVARGSYLVKAGNCMACHTARGQPAFAGGRLLPTNFGQFYTPNITPDKSTGIGNWSVDDFWRALHDGIGRDGRLLYPAFPYTEYTKVSRADADAMFAYLQSVAPVSLANREHALSFPFNWRPLLLVWRSLFFSAQLYEDDAGHTAQWNRGAYLVQGLGHCTSCHTERNLLGASTGLALAGAEMDELNWFATSLIADNQSGHASMPTDQLQQRLQQGMAQQGRVYGPMAEVVKESLQYLSDADLLAMVLYLRSQQVNTPLGEFDKPGQRELAETMYRGEKVYTSHCKQCHQADGTGKSPAYPALPGSRLVNLASTTNLTRILLNGGFSPATQYNPQPYGMPPFAQLLSSQEIADVASYVRNSWGNQGSLLIAAEVDRYRGQASH